MYLFTLQLLPVQDALRCLQAHRMEVNEDAYTLALMGYAYALYDPHGADYASIMDRLDTLAIRGQHSNTASTLTGDRSAWVTSVRNQLT